MTYSAETMSGTTTSTTSVSALSAAFEVVQVELPAKKEVIQTRAGDTILARTTSLNEAQHIKKGKPKVPSGPYKCRATQTTPRFDLLKPGEPVAFDGEFQNYLAPGMDKWAHRLARGAIISFEGHNILDVYAYYPNVEGVQKRYPPKEFQVCGQDLRSENGAKSAQQVEKWCRDIFRGRKVVVHDATHDSTCFFFFKDAMSPANGVTIVDTQKLYRHLQIDGTPGLAKTAWAILKKSIQEGGYHSAVEDAATAMELYLAMYPDEKKRLTDAKKRSKLFEQQKKKGKKEMARIE